MDGKMTHENYTSSELIKIFCVENMKAEEVWCSALRGSMEVM